MSKTLDEAAWYALRVRPRWEAQVADSLSAKGLQTFLPVYTVTKRWSDRVKRSEAPLFDGYVFCQADIQNRLPVLVTPGVLHFVGIGKTPVPVDPVEMSAVQSAMQSGRQVRPWPFLREGERVRIDDGPLRNLEGILLQAQSDDVVVLSVTLLQRSMAVRIDRNWITPLRSWLRH